MLRRELGDKILQIRDISVVYEAGTRLHCLISKEGNIPYISGALSGEFVPAHL
jgi:hypothetical protein